MSSKERPVSAWLPITKKEVEERGWGELDVILITGDAFIDHPAFGAAVVGRIIQSEGFRVAIIPQPNWQDDLHDFKKLGAPKLFFAVTSGNMDSMVNHYTARMRRTATDAYSPDGTETRLCSYCIYSDTKKTISRDTHSGWWHRSFTQTSDALRLLER
jgi:hypothetical protein